jgi:hypothetical protein
MPVSPGGPEVLIGGYLPRAVQRVGRFGDGYIHEGPPAQAAELYRGAEESWKAAGRTGRPRFVGIFYFGLGPDAREKASASLADYYAFALGPAPEGASAALRELADMRRPIIEASIQSTPTTPPAVQHALEAYRDVGMDEVIALPAIAELEQVNRLAEVVNRIAGL